MRARFLVGAVAAADALLGSPSGRSASAEILYLNGSVGASGSASALANGAAVATGDAANASVTVETRAEYSASSTPDDAGGGVSMSMGFASAALLGEASSTATVTGAPVVDSWDSRGGETTRTTTLTTTSTTTEVETLAATAFDYEELAAAFDSPSSGTFTFHGATATSLEGAVMTTIASTRTKTIVTERDKPGGTAPQTRTAVTESTRVKTFDAPPDDPSLSISGYAESEAASANFAAYTFEALGAPGGRVVMTYATQASLDDAVSYGIELVDQSTQTLVGVPDEIGPNARGTAAWNFASAGVYTLFIIGRSDIGALASDARQTFTESSLDWSDGVFQMTISPADVSTAPELSTWAMMLVGFAGLVQIRCRQARGAIALIRSARSKG